MSEIRWNPKSSSAQTRSAAGKNRMRIASVGIGSDARGGICA